MQIDGKFHRDRIAIVAEMDKEFQKWIKHWRELSEYFLTRRQPWLMTQRQRQVKDWRNTMLLDSTSTEALHVLSSGMMDSITSPARPWFRLGIAGIDTDMLDNESKIYLEETTRMMLEAIADTNTYDTLAVTYQDWAGMGSACTFIREDANELFRCYNHPVGSFRFGVDAAGRVNRVSLEYEMSVEDLVTEFGLKNCSTMVQTDYKEGGQRRLKMITVICLVELHDDTEGVKLKAKVPYHELFWEKTETNGNVLDIRPLYEWPGPCPRWELHGNQPYGTAPTMDALGDVKQLQHMLRRRGQALDKLLDPPMLVDQSLANRPKALSARGITYANLSNGSQGAKPVYTINPPLQEMNGDILDLRDRIRSTMHNPLFTMFSNLDTVRSAAEIGELKEEKLVLLGPVLGRYEYEGLDTMLSRIYGIMDRAGALLPKPESLKDIPIDVTYISVLSDAQRAVSTIPIERFMAFTGELSAVYPDMRHLPNVEEIGRDYATAIGVKPSGLRTREEVEALIAADQQQEEAQRALDVGTQLAPAAQQLSQTDVGGGQNALEAMVQGGI